MTRFRRIEKELGSFHARVVRNATATQTVDASDFEVDVDASMSAEVDFDVDLDFDIDLDGDSDGPTEFGVKNSIARTETAEPKC